MDEETKAVSDAFLKGVNGLLNDLQGPSGYSSYDRNSETLSPSPQLASSVNVDASAPFFALNKSGDSTVPGIATELSHGELYPRPPPFGVRQETSSATYTSPLPARITAPQTKTHSPLYALPPGMSLNHIPTVAKHGEQPASYSTKELATPTKNNESENEAARRLSARIASTREYLARGSAHHGSTTGLRSSGSFGSASPGASLDASGEAQQSYSARPHPPPPPEEEEEEEEDGPPPEPMLSAHTVLSPVPAAYRSQSSQNERAIEEPSFGFDSPRRGRDRNGPISISLGSVPINTSGSSSSDAKPFSMTRAYVSDLKSPKTIASSPEKNPRAKSVDHEVNASTFADAQKLVVFFAAQMGLSSSSSLTVNDAPLGSSMLPRNAALQRIDWSSCVMAVLKTQVMDHL